MEKHKFIRVLILVSIIIALVLLLYVTIDYTYFSIFPDLSEPDAFNYCRCNNLKNKTGRVVNGLQVDRDDLKWVAFLFLRFSYGFFQLSISSFCTSVILNKKFALTAAHCFNQYLEFKKMQRLDLPLFVGAGLDHQLKNIAASEENFRKVYEFYKSPAGDIALIELEEPFFFGHKTGIYPACISERFPLNLNQELIATGYGLIKPTKIKDVREGNGLIDKKRTQTLLMTTFRRVISRFNIITVANSESSLCFGDSGGPLHRYNSTDDKLYVIAIASSGQDYSNNGEVTLCLPGSINNFEPIFKHIKFIKKQIGNHSCLTNTFSKDELKIDANFIIKILCLSFLIILIIILLVLNCLCLKNINEYESFKTYYKVYVRDLFKQDLE